MASSQEPALFRILVQIPPLIELSRSREGKQLYLITLSLRLVEVVMKKDRALVSDIMNKTKEKHPTCHQGHSLPGMFDLGMMMSIKTREESLLDSKGMNATLITEEEK